MLGAIAGIIGSIFQNQAAQDAIAIQQQQLQFQKENADRQYALATATRPDVYGNEISYDDVQNAWDVSLTPFQKAIIDATQREQGLSVTEDAMRDRSLKRRQEFRSKGAYEDYNDAQADYLYGEDKPGSRDSYISDAMRMAALGRDRAVGDLSRPLVRSALRAGDGADIGEIFKKVNDKAGDSWVGDILRAKQAGTQNWAADNSAWDSHGQGKAGYLAKISDAIGPSEIRFSDTPDRADNTLRSMLSGISGSLTNASRQVGGAFDSLAGAVGQGGLDLSGVASALANLKIGGTPGTFNAPVVDPFVRSTPAADRTTAATGTGWW